LTLEFPTAKLATKAAGNAYPPPMIMAGAHGMLKAIAAYLASKSPVPIAIHVPRGRGVPNLARFLGALTAPPRSILACPKARAKAAAKAKSKAREAAAAKAKSVKRKAGQSYNHSY